MQDSWQDRQENLLHFPLTKAILRCCFEVINTLRVGFLESVYKNSLQIALLDGGLKADPDRGFEVIFRGKKVGIFIPDLIVDDVVIVELNDQPSCNPGPPPGTMEPSQKMMSIGHHFRAPPSGAGKAAKDNQVILSSSEEFLSIYGEVLLKLVSIYSESTRLS